MPQPHAILRTPCAMFFSVPKAARMLIGMLIGACDPDVVVVSKLGLQADDVLARCRDLGSTGGTFVLRRDADNPSAGFVKLAQGDEIELRCYDLIKTGHLRDEGYVFPLFFFFFLSRRTRSVVYFYFI